MSQVLGDGVGVTDLDEEATNEQLATPALSPIAEYGTNGDLNQPFAFHERRNEIPSSGLRNRELPRLATSAISQENRKPNNGGLTTSTPTNSESNRTHRLSPQQIKELTDAPASVPLRPASPPLEEPTRSRETVGSLHNTPVNRSILFLSLIHI